MAERKCGGCTACCKTHSITELKKDAGVWCSHCEIGKGCSIYASRPIECQFFKCAWLKGQAGSDAFRPDRTKVVPEYKVMSEIGWVLWLFEVEVKALDAEPILKWTLNNLFQKNSVLHYPVYSYSEPKLYLGKEMKKPKGIYRLESRPIIIYTFEQSVDVLLRKKVG